MVKKGVILTQTHKVTKKKEFQGSVALGGGCFLLGPRKKKHSVARDKLEKIARKLGIDVNWING